MGMRKKDMQRLWALVGRLSRAQRQEVIDSLKAQATAVESIELVESARPQSRSCPYCGEHRIVRNGVADGLQRYKCRACGKTFNALTGTPLARLRHKGKWLDQAQALADGLTVKRAAEHLNVAPSTAFRWRHRFLAVPRSVKPNALAGVAEIDETYVLESFKGQRVVGRKARKRGGSAAKRGLSREQIPVLVARDRSGTTTDYVLSDSRKAAVMAVLKPLLPSDAVVCTDGGGSIGQAVKDLGLEHHRVVTSSGTHAVGAWHIQNVNSYHGRLKGWMRRFNGVATGYLENYLGWFRALDRTPRSPRQPAQLLNLAIGA
jgi:transposase-like protein